jgi:hypothetical protein
LLTLEKLSVKDKKNTLGRSLCQAITIGAGVLFARLLQP